MPVQPQPVAAERICEAVDGAVWASYDHGHRLLFLGHAHPGIGWMVHVIDVVTGEPHDQPWPVEPEQVELVGYRGAFEAAVAERVAQGF
jgi:hypothetical protein